jgi:ABC-2 type transport system ATP-binding protein
MMDSEPVAPSPPRLEVRGLRVARGSRRVLEDVSFEVRRGEAFGILGPNGAGKTTCFHILTGLLAPDAGQIFLDGRGSGPADPEFRVRVGVVFQSPALDPRLTARENLLFASRLYAVPAADARKRVTALLARAELTERAADPVAQLSGGLMRRLELARALVHDPEILILDEPTTGLDEAAFRRTWADLLALRRDRGLTLLLTTHRPDEAEMCDRLAILDGGRLVACDTPDRLRARVRGDLILIETDAPDSVATALAARLGVETKILDGRVAVERPRGHELVPRLVEALPEGAVRSVSVRRPGLGEAFLDLTGHSLDLDQGRP